MRKFLCALATLAMLTGGVGAYFVATSSPAAAGHCHICKFN